MDIDTIIGASPDDILREIGRRVRARRLELNLTQKAFAKRAGVGYDAYRRFENSGEITLRNLVLSAIVLNDIEDLRQLFTRENYENLDQLLKIERDKKRLRGSRNG